MNITEIEENKHMLERIIKTEMEAFEFILFLQKRGWLYHMDERADDCLRNSGLTSNFIRAIQVQADSATEAAEDIHALCMIACNMSDDDVAPAEYALDVLAIAQRALKPEPVHCESVVIIRHLTPERAKLISDFVDGCDIEYAGVQTIHQYSGDPSLDEMITNAL